MSFYQKIRDGCYPAEQPELRPGEPGWEPVLQGRGRYSK